MPTIAFSKAESKCEVHFVNIKSTSRTLIRAEGLCKNYGDRNVLDRFSFELKAGEVLGFLGANGAGKSTTLRILLSLVRPDHGRFELLGEGFPGGSRRALARVGALIERADLYPHLSARENLSILARLSGMKDSARIDDVLKQVGLAARAKDPVKQFSQGMKQRLGLAQAIVHGPELLILDEPMTGLDPPGMRSMREWIHRLAREDGMAVLFSSHLLSEVEQLADRVMVIDAGRKLADGSIEELYQQMGGSRWELHTRHAAASHTVLSRICTDLSDLSDRPFGLSFRAGDFPAERVLEELAAARITPSQLRRADNLEELLHRLAGEK